MPGTDNFVLRSTVTSPFGRKVRMAIDVLKLADRIKLEPADPLDESDTLRQQNPLGKMPCPCWPTAARSTTAVSSLNICRMSPALTGCCRSRGATATAR
jgi:hypothetical protein